MTLVGQMNCEEGNPPRDALYFIMQFPQQKKEAIFKQHPKGFVMQNCLLTNPDLQMPLSFFF